MIPYYTIPLLFLQAMPSLIKNILPGFLIFCVFLTNYATAQNINPFELEERIDSVLSANSKSETIKTDDKCKNCGEGYTVYQCKKCPMHSALHWSEVFAHDNGGCSN